MLKLIVKYDSYYRNDAILSIMCVKGVPKKVVHMGDYTIFQKLTSLIGK